MLAPSFHVRRSRRFRSRRTSLVTQGDDRIDLCGETRGNVRADQQSSAHDERRQNCEQICRIHSEQPSFDGSECLVTGGDT